MDVLSPSLMKKIRQGIVLYGRHAVSAALQNRRRIIHHLFCQSNQLDELTQMADQSPIKRPNILCLNADQLNDLFPGKPLHQGLFAHVSALAQPSLKDVMGRRSCLLVFLDQLTDPQNIGAIFRSAAAFGAHGIVSLKKNAPCENGILAKSACGTLETIPFIKISNLSQALDELKKNDFWVLGLDGHSSTKLSSFSCTPQTKIALILGKESTGMRRLTQEKCDEILSIPIAPKVESLNVSNAAAIALYELNQKINPPKT